LLTFVIDLIKADITTLAVDAIVNAANSALSGGGGVDGAIHRAAGPELLAACRALKACPVGEAVTTPGFGLPSRFVIHAVGPVWEGGERGEEAVLERAYANVFVQAQRHAVRSIAFPAISAGAFRFPLEKAARIALQSMLAHEAYFQRIVACLFDEKALTEYQQALRALRPSTSGGASL
jgi:O-acetyl-ADP-ribose deacetylase (regulator of RNase III)